MKLLRHGPRGRERPGLLDSQGQVRDLGDLLADITPATLSPGGLSALRALDPNALPVVPQGTPFSSVLPSSMRLSYSYVTHSARRPAPSRQRSRNRHSPCP